MKCEKCGSEDLLLYTYCEDGQAIALHGLCRKCGFDGVAPYSTKFIGWNPSTRGYPWEGEVIHVKRITSC